MGAVGGDAVSVHADGGGLERNSLWPTDLVCQSRNSRVVIIKDHWLNLQIAGFSGVRIKPKRFTLEG